MDWSLKPQRSGVSGGKGLEDDVGRTSIPLTSMPLVVKLARAEDIPLVIILQRK